MNAEQNKAYQLTGTGSVENLQPHLLPMPTPQRGEVLVRVAAVSMNYRDLALVHGRYFHDSTAGYIPMCDGVGEIVEVGESVSDFSIGDRVISVFNPRWFAGPRPDHVPHEEYGTYQDGWLVQYKAVSQEALLPLPAGISFTAGSTLSCAATTAWSALNAAGRIDSSDTVLTLGTGAVSLFAIQLAKAAGAQVIATTSSADKEELVRGLGADLVINYRDEPEWGAIAKSASGGGVSRVVEVGGAGTINQSIASVRYGGVISLVGFLTEEGQGIDYMTLFASGATVRHVHVGSRADTADMLEAVEFAGIAPVIDRSFPFDEAQAAWRYFDSRTTAGKVILEF